MADQCIVHDVDCLAIYEEPGAATLAEHKAAYQEAIRVAGKAFAKWQACPTGAEGWSAALWDYDRLSNRAADIGAAYTKAWNAACVNEQRALVDAVMRENVRDCLTVGQFARQITGLE